MPQLASLQSVIRHMTSSAFHENERDSDLLAQFVASRSEDAFAELVRRHGPMVLSLCRRLLRDEHLAEDAFQAAFLVLARKATTIRKAASLAGWLYRVARHVALRAQSQFQPPSANELRGDEMTTPQSAECGSEFDLREIIDEEVAKLPERYRILIVLCYLQGRSYAEAAAELNCPLGTVAGRLARAREKLCRCLLRRGVVLSVSGLITLVSPSLSGSLRAATVRAVAGGDVSKRAVILAHGVLQSMKWIKLAGLTSVLLLVGVALSAVASMPRSTEEPGTNDVAVLAASTEREPKAVRTAPFPSLGFGYSKLVFAADDKTLFLTEGIGVRSWGVATGKPGNPWQKPGYFVGTEARNGAVAVKRSAFEGGALVLLDAGTGKTLKVLDDEGANNYWREQFTFSSDGKWFVKGEMRADQSTLVRFWETDTGRELPSLPYPDGLANIRTLMISPDRKLLILGSFGSHHVDVWDVAKARRSKQLLGERQGHANDRNPQGARTRVVAITALASSPDGSKLAAGNNDGGIDIWDLKAGKTVLHLGAISLPLKDFTVRGIAKLLFSRDGKSLFALDGFDGAGDRRLRRWNLTSGKQMALPTDAPMIHDFAISADEQLLAILVPAEKKKARIEILPMKSRQPDAKPEKQGEAVKISLEVAKQASTVGEVNNGSFTFALVFENAGKQPMTLYPYVSPRLYDAGGKDVKRSAYIGRYGERTKDSIIEEIPFFTLKPGETKRWPMNVASFDYDPKAIRGWQIPGAGHYRLELHYHYNRAAARKEFGEGCKDQDNPLRPWNQAVEVDRTFEVEIRATK